ncbi:MAG TPA: enoyl-CoA hydratase-related protein [Novosphingobium sp.]|nr:enoyl-CoA hydratase-related protein [Novosphingobium sp.]HMP57329.1 enoyl-CoA hydratase-related protein [Novosphingobium sp.]
MTQSDPIVLVSREGGVATVTLNRPERRNGVTAQLCIALHRALAEIAQSDAGVVILRGAGSDFCVGADIGGPGGEALDPRDLRPAYHASTLLHTMPQVTIAAIDGGCAGAGMGWAMACDLRYASTRARFNTAFLAVGVSGDMGLAWSLTRLVGGARARELLLFPGKLQADRAEALGLVGSLFAPERLHAEVARLARGLAARDALALRLMKANFVSAEVLALGDYIEVETERHIEASSRPGMAERLAAGLRETKG